jgi:hypothetical protein
MQGEPFMDLIFILILLNRCAGGAKPQLSGAECAAGRGIDRLPHRWRNKRIQFTIILSKRFCVG